VVSTEWRSIKSACWLLEGLPSGLISMNMIAAKLALSKRNLQRWTTGRG
jgi:hypothetical protein